MTLVISVNPVKTGLIYLNDFTTTDGTTKFGGAAWALVTGAPGTASYLNETGTLLGEATTNAAASDMCVFTNFQFGNAINQGNGICLRLTDGNNFYFVAYTNISSNPLLHLKKNLAGTQSDVTTVSVSAASINTWYELQAFLKGPSFSGAFNEAGTVYTLSATDTNITSGNYGGAVTSNAGKFDYLLITSSNVITMTGLIDAQKFRVYKSGALIATSNPSNTGTCVCTIPIGSFPNPPYDRIIVADTDGVTPIFTYTNTGSIYPGDSLRAVTTTSLLKNPPPVKPLLTSNPRIVFNTTKKAYT